MTVELDARTYLVGLHTSERIFVGGVRAASPPAVPSRAIFILESGGPPATGYMDAGGGSSWRPARVVIRIRGEPNSYASTKSLADTVYREMWAARIGAYHCRCEQGAPVFIGRDAQECDEFVISVLMEYKAA